MKAVTSHQLTTRILAQQCNRHLNQHCPIVASVHYVAAALQLHSATVCHQSLQVVMWRQPHLAVTSAQLSQSTTRHASRQYSVATLTLTSFVEN
jgi:hypothetical protein